MYSSVVKTSKAKKNDKETIAELEEIISDLLNDKAEIQRIAQDYEQELVSQKITEDDIKYITENLLPIFSEFVPNQLEIEQLEKILSVERLIIMQLIGFNYKKAIGEPLTLLLRKAIESKIPMDAQTNANYVLAMAELAKNKFIFSTIIMNYHLKNTLQAQNKMLEYVPKKERKRK